MIWFWWSYMGIFLNSPDPDPTCRLDGTVTVNKLGGTVTANKLGGQIVCD